MDFQKFHSMTKDSCSDNAHYSYLECLIKYWVLQQSPKLQGVRSKEMMTKA